MLSRLTLAARQGSKIPLVATLRPSVAAAQRLVSTSQNSKTSQEVVEVASNKSAWEIYKEKAGTSAPTVFGIGLSAYLLSKEIFIIHDETVILVVMLGTVSWLVSKVGGPVAEYLDQRSQDMLDRFNASKLAQIDAIQVAIKEQEGIEDILSCRKDVFAVSRENNAMKLEIEYRTRMNEMYEEVKKRLDYQVDLAHLQQQLEKNHIANWLEAQVVKSITPQQEKDALAQCVKDIKSIVQARV